PQARRPRSRHRARSPLPPDSSANDPAKLGREITDELVELRLATFGDRDREISTALGEDVRGPIVCLEDALHEDDVPCADDEAPRDHSHSCLLGVTPQTPTF